MSGPRWIRSALLVAPLWLVACRSPSGRTIVVFAPAAGDAMTERIATEAQRYLQGISNEDVEIERIEAAGLGDIEAAARRTEAGLVFVVDAQSLAPDRIDEARLDALGPSGFVIETHDVGAWKQRLEGDGATVMLLGGVTRLARQYALYEGLRRMGVRFFHPEQEWVPTHRLDDLRDLARTPTALHRDGADYTPDFRWRSWSFHSSHPLEHLEAFSDSDAPIDEAVAVNEWIVKNRGNRFRDAGRGIAPQPRRQLRRAQLDALRESLGFPRGAGIRLHNQQQGADAEVDPHSESSARAQIEALVERKLAEVPDAQWLGIHFGPTEFTTTPDVETVQWLDWAGAKALELDPDLDVEINVHITGRQPTPHYDDLGCANGTSDAGRGDYYDLAFHTDTRLGASVHTTMFYPLQGAAPVYNQETFAHKLCLMQRASAAGRPLSWFPEGSWWLSFDDAIPVYLPLYVWSRWRDVQLTAPLLTSRGGTLRGHRMFTSGQEWGYWQQDYAVGLWSWNVDVTLEQALGEMFDPLCGPDDWREGCNARTEAIQVLEEVMDHQRDFFLERPDFRGRRGGLYFYFAGEDSADEIAAASGLTFRPLRVSFSEVMRWDREALHRFESSDLSALDEAARKYAIWVERLGALRGQAPAHGRPFLDEVIDGLEVNEVRASHTVALYRAVIAHRRAQLDPRVADTASDFLQRAQTLLARATSVIRRREAAYRYPPAQTFGGGLTPATAVANGTTYPYRLYTKAHELTYWTLREGEVRRLLDASDLETGSEPALTQALAPLGTPLRVVWPGSSATGTLSIGGRTPVAAGTRSVDLGAEPGYWEVSGVLTRNGRDLAMRGAVARTDLLATSDRASVTLTQPSAILAQRVLRSVFPAVQWGYLEKERAVVFAPHAEPDGEVNYGDLVLAPIARLRHDAFETSSFSFALPIRLKGGRTLTIRVVRAQLSGTVGPRGLQGSVSLAGELSIADLVAGLQELAGFDEKGALAMLGSLLGFDPSHAPQHAPFAAEIAVSDMFPPS